MSTAPSVLTSVAELNSLPPGSTIEVTATSAATIDRFNVGCQRIPFTDIWSAGGTIAAAPNARLRATAPLTKRFSGTFALNERVICNAADIIGYCDRIELKEREPELPGDRVRALMSPGLYVCVSPDHGHIFILTRRGSWGALNKTTLLPLRDEVQGPSEHCVLQQGVGLRWVAAMERSGQEDHVETTTYRHIVSATSPNDVVRARQGRVLRKVD